MLHSSYYRRIYSNTYTFQLRMVDIISFFFFFLSPRILYKQQFSNHNIVYLIVVSSSIKFIVGIV